jgi:hypothetical protein
VTFHISSQGVNNTVGTSAKFNGGGSVKIRGNFENTGDVQVDVRADLEVLGNVVNDGTFNIKDYVTENQYQRFEQAINDLQGDAKNYLESSYQDLKRGDIPSANNWFKKFANYITEHPELVTASVQIVLQLFGTSLSS